MEIAGRVFLVTGASRGIGRALAEVLAASGARLALCARHQGPLTAAADACRALGARVLARAADVGDDAAVGAFVDATHATFGRVDVLVNNAAVLPAPAPVTRIPPEVWAETLRVNVIGTANLIRRVLPGMEARGDGVIVNLTSGWGREAEARVAPYCASKFAVEALTRSVALEAGPGIVVFAVNPGIIATDMLTTAFAGEAGLYPPPEALAPHWLGLFREVAPTWNGTSRDLTSDGEVLVGRDPVP